VYHVVNASSYQPSEASAGFIPRPNQEWKTSCSSDPTEAVVAPSYSMPRVLPHTHVRNRSPCP
jgi:hypothetical protein